MQGHRAAVLAVLVALAWCAHSACVLPEVPEYGQRGCAPGGGTVTGDTCTLECPLPYTLVVSNGTALAVGPSSITVTCLANGTYANQAEWDSGLCLPFSPVDSQLLKTSPAGLETTPDVLLQADVTLRDATGAVSASISAPTLVVLEAPVAPSVSIELVPLSLSRYIVTVANTTVAGTYRFDLRVDNVSLSSWLPLEMVVVPGSVYGPLSTIPTGDSLDDATVNIESSFVITTRDRWGNRIHVGGQAGDFTVTIRNVDFVQGSSVQDLNNGQYRVSFIPANGGLFSVSIEIDFERVAGAPWVLFIETNCDPGDFSQDDVCKPCPVASYTDERNMRACIACPETTTTASVSTPSLLNCTCQERFYTTAGIGGAACTPCPSGGVCTGGLALPYPEPGYFPSNDQAHVFLECLPRRACIGGYPFRCATGYSGRLCGECAKGYYKLNLDCMPCDGTSAETIMFLFCLMAFVFSMTLLWFNTRDSVAHKFVALVIGFNALQISAIYGSIALEWPPEARSIMNVFSFLNLNLDLAAPECTVSGDNIWLIKWAFTLALPILFLIPFAASYALGLAYVKAVQLFGPQFKARFPGFCEKPPSSGHTWLQRLRYRISRIFTHAKETPSSLLQASGRAYWQLLSLSYLPLCMMSLRYFDCAQGADGAYTLTSNPSKKCYDSAYWSLFPLAVILAVIYCLGIPLSLGVWLVRKRKQLDDFLFHLRYGFLVARFQPSFYHFEIHIEARKFGVVACAVFLATAYHKALFACFVLAISWGLLCYWSPYLASYHNKLAVFCLACCVFVLWGGTMDPDRVESVNRLRNVVIIGGLILNLLAIFIGVVYDFYRMAREEAEAFWSSGYDSSDSSNSGGRVASAASMFVQDDENEGRFDAMDTQALSLADAANLTYVEGMDIPQEGEDEGSLATLDHEADFVAGGEALSIVYGSVDDPLSGQFASANPWDGGNIAGADQGIQMQSFTFDTSTGSNQGGPQLGSTQFGSNQFGSNQFGSNQFGSSNQFGAPAPISSGGTGDKGIDYGSFQAPPAVDSSGSSSDSLM